ncbi:MAG: CAP domain-containing protein [Sphaerobacter sp.]|nr:CAP domain-containing protein [Sphaerobacter sp.]
MTPPGAAQPRGPRPRHLLGLVLTLLIIVLPALSVSPPAAAADPFDDVLATINTYRAWLGLPPMRRHPALDAAASSHARYYQLNAGDPSLAGMGLHQEQPGRPGFTGADMQDRARAAGYTGWVNENIGLSGSMAASVDWFIATINHRLTLIDPRYTDIGFGAVNDGKVRIEVINVGAPTWSDTATPEWVAWPPDGTTGVGLKFWGEAPNPFPGASYPVGYPITLKYHGRGTVVFTRATLTAGGQPVPVIAQTGNGWLTRRTFMIAATSPLQPGTTYTVTVEGQLDGAPFTRTWSFRTASGDGERLSRGLPVAPPPAGVATADPAVRQLWQATDGLVGTGIDGRTWLWGPDTFAAPREPYVEAPGGTRQVYYFDKARMEITNPAGDRSSPWFVTSGLLVRDMIRGEVQVGDARFQPVGPANVPVAGDPAPQNPDAPTYAALRGVATVAGDHRAPKRIGAAVRETLHQSGAVGTEPSLAGYTTLAAYDEVTGHNVARVFHDWLAAQPWQATYVVGRPITEPYWVRARVQGSPQWVLIQAFERRLLTYTPANPPGWQIEMGNVGRHYYEWRYGEPPPTR